MITILGIAGSVRRGSFNRTLLECAREHLPARVRLDIWTGLAAVPVFSEDDEHLPPPEVTEMRQALRAAAGLLIATPEYNGSIPGQLKNALDWASRPYRDSALTGLPAAVIGASPSPGGTASAQADMRRVLGRAGADVVDADLAVAHAYRQLDERGRLLDPQLGGRLTDLLAELARRGPRSVAEVA